MAAPPIPGTIFRVAGLDPGRDHAVLVEPDAATLAELAQAVGAQTLRKVRLEGRLFVAGRTDWTFEGQLGATAVQPCVVTLAPVTTRIDGPVRRRFVRDPAPVEDEEFEMPEDTDEVPLGAEIDLGAVLAEEIALGLPDFPRAGVADFAARVFGPPGVAPLTDEAAHPFAGLSALRDNPKK